MAIKLSRIGHAALRVRDTDIAKKFYTEVLGFDIVEEDPEHGGVFMSLTGDGHTIDLAPVDNPDAPQAHLGGQDTVGLIHIAFKVSSYQTLKEAYETLQANVV